MSKKYFQPVPPQPDFVKEERKILRWWYQAGVVKKYLRKNRQAKKRFSFLDGPITANNPMGVHHAWGRTLKDLYQRYKNMQGFAQRFQNGFDNQGLWVEVEVEKKLGFRSKKEIEKYGLAKFVNQCKKHTLGFAKVQTKQSQRLGYFMDWGNDYYTMSEENNYAIWHFLKKCWQDGNLYKGRDSVPWCPRCGTAISQHEILTEEYKELTHDSVYFKLPILNDQKKNYFLVWTTTPWTIPGNVALAVNPQAEYWLVNHCWLAASLAKKVFGSQAKPQQKAKGSQLVGLKYQAPFDQFAAVQAACRENPQTFHTVVAAEELVSAEEGTGIVHIAPGCGTEDFRLGLKTHLPVLPVIDEAAYYLPGFGDLSGKNAKDNPSLVLNHPLLKDYLFKIEPYTHRYPTCWRCKSELVWRVVDEWYIAMDDSRHPGARNYRQELMEVIKSVNWIPEFGYERELDWLRNMEDWLISKKRYWGLALPIWECECGYFTVIGSRQELQEKAVEGWKKFVGHTPHRPWVDAVKIKCPRCGKVISRIADVGNPWLDAGIVPFSTLGYFRQRKYWQKWFPADLVLECFPGQFRNWFYSLLAMSVVLEKKAPFKNLLGHGLVKDEKGEEMHKSKGNAIWFDEAAEKMGVDTMRWLYARHNPALNLNFGYSIADEVRRQFIFLYWNAYRFFITYADFHHWSPPQRITPPKALTVLDQWILSRWEETKKTVAHKLDQFAHHEALRATEEFLADLSGWYIRRSRQRLAFFNPQQKDRQICLQTLYYLLHQLSLVLAPFIPFLTETIWQNLTGHGQKWSAKDSVHLQDWPSVAEKFLRPALEKKMSRVREAVALGHAQRKAKQIGVRQPLPKLVIYNSNFKNFEKGLIQLIKEELNVKEIEIKASKGKLKVELDTQITPELKKEGEARQLIRQIQLLRRQQGLKLRDKVIVFAPSWPAEWEEEIKKKTGASRLVRQKGELRIQKKTC